MVPPEEQHVHILKADRFQNGEPAGKPLQDLPLFIGDKSTGKAPR
jgi:hypothetical protein